MYLKVNFGVPETRPQRSRISHVRSAYYVECLPMNINAMTEVPQGLFLFCACSFSALVPFLRLFPLRLYPALVPLRLFPGACSFSLLVPFLRLFPNCACSLFYSCGLHII